MLGCTFALFSIIGHFYEQAYKSWYGHIQLFMCVFVCMYLNMPWEKIRDYFELNKTETTAHYNRWDVTKSLFRGIFIEQNDYNRKKTKVFN